MNWVDARDRLRIVLRSTTSPSQGWRAAAIDPDRALVRRGLAPFLHVLLAVDDVDRMVFVSRGQLEEWGREPDEVWSLASSNVDPTDGLEKMGSLWRLKSADGYEASRLAVRGWLGAFSGRVQGQAIAVVPHARLLLVGGDDDAAELLELAMQGWETAGNPISPCAYTLLDGQLLPWMPAPNHPSHKAAMRAMKRLAHREYEEQRRLLEDVTDDVLARVGLLEGDGGNLFTVSSWTEGTQPLLPIADLVVMHPADGTELWVPFRSIGSCCRTLLSAHAGLEPVRVRATGWPDAATWEKLREVSVEGM